MNRKLAMGASVLNVVTVALFGIFIIAGFPVGSYMICMLLAISYVVMTVAFSYYASEDKKISGNTAMIFAVVYCVLILLVYFAQVTTVRMDHMEQSINRILNYEQFGLYFNYDLLGYGMMALSTFFAGLTIQADRIQDRILKILLMVHGIFFPLAFIIPMLGMFTAGSSESNTSGAFILFFWCIYFIPVGILSCIYFSKQNKKTRLQM